MVGPGEVDDDLEPEVKEECNGKYGDVLSVNVIELPEKWPKTTFRMNNDRWASCVTLKKVYKGIDYPYSIN